MDKKIQKFLEAERIKFKTIKHRKVYTAFNAAETQHINPKEVVKTVLVKFDKQIAFVEEVAPAKKAAKGATPSLKIDKFGMALVAVPAGRHLDFKKIDAFILDTQTKLYKKLIKKYPKLAKPIKVRTSVAKEKDIAGKLKTKYLLAPLALYGLPLFVDKKLTQNKNFVFTAGSFTESVAVPTAQYLTAVKPILGAFAK